MAGMCAGWVAPSAIASSRTWAGGSGNWTLAGNWGGTAPVAGDELIFSGSSVTNTNNFTAGTAFSGITFASGASAFTLSGTNSITLSGYITNSSSTAQTISIPLSIASEIIVDTGATGITLGGSGASAGGVISGAGGLTKNGTGTLTLNAKNTYTGATTINSGTLAMGNTSEGNLSSTTAVTIASGATLALGAYSPISPTRQAGSIAGAGNITSTANASTFTVGGDNTSTLFSGKLSAGVGQQLTLTKVGTGVLTLSGANTNMATQITGGMVVFQNTSAQSNKTVTVAAAGSVGLGVGGSGSYTEANVVSLFNSSLASFTLDAASGVGIDTTAGNFTLATALTAARKLTKLGANTLTISSSNTYSGGTLISAGAVLANTSSGSALGSGAATVASGATLGGSGRIGAATTISNGATLSAGGTLSSIGTLTFTSGITFATGSILDFQLGAASSDKLVVSGGTLTGAGDDTITVNLTDAGDFAAGTYTLIDATGATFSNFDASTFEIGETIDGYTFTFSRSGNLIQLIATTAVVPEPSIYAAFAGVVTLALAAGYRRRRG